MEFEPESTESGRLGFNTIFTLDLEVTEQKPGLPITNDPGEINRALLQAEEINTKIQIRTKLEVVAYGTLKGTPAALIIFCSEFMHTTRYRIKWATIRLSLYDTASPDNIKLAPTIATIFPERARGPPSECTKKSQSTVRVSAGIQRMQEFAASYQRSWEGSGVKEYGEISGIKCSTNNRIRRVENRVVWVLNENGVAKDGIPRVFRGAVLLRNCDRPFHLSMQVEVRHGILGHVGDLLRKSTGREDDPVMFVPGKQYFVDGRGSNLPANGVFDGLALQNLVNLPPDMVAYS